MSDVRKTANCDACGHEHFIDELMPVKISGFSHHLAVCEDCLGKTTYECYKDAAEVLAAVKIIASGKDDPDARLKEICKLLGD